MITYQVKKTKKHKKWRQHLYWGYPLQYLAENVYAYISKGTEKCTNWEILSKIVVRLFRFYRVLLKNRYNYMKTRRYIAIHIYYRMRSIDLNVHTMFKNWICNYLDSIWSDKNYQRKTIYFYTDALLFPGDWPINT